MNRFRQYSIYRILCATDDRIRHDAIRSVGAPANNTTIPVFGSIGTVAIMDVSRLSVACACVRELGKIVLTDGLFFCLIYRSPLSTWSSVSVVVSSSPPSRLSPPSTTARSPSAASATPAFPPVPPTAARRSVVTPTSSAPRRSSNRRSSYYGFSALLGKRAAGVTIRLQRGRFSTRRWNDESL
ncbi:uncharacterized protein BO80DRAFT_145847 [Aspergillus ibericus CBS 121593]|uniref:Uncharacterized protein n=1 Tax=Aspergillus ibericus CBS 121593 TaxID=1448316 RepID=A0A395GU65_9EURO|nr:hypothetical protein BO80DRAFT_145847 [Aspergillus ibericus CBS 121593]RAK99111.1 hypothetical protein BO80DRAFT_145847 [Aspergillus ibericus CBS 121593]